MPDRKKQNEKVHDDLERLMDQNRRLTDEVKRRIDQLAAINSVATVVGQSLDLDVTLATALGTVLDVIDNEAAGISLIDEESQDLVLRAQHGWKRDFVEMGMRMPKGHGLAWYAIEHDEVVVTGDVSQDERIKHQAFQEEGIQAQALAPMHARGRVIGILSALSYEGYTYSDEELTVLSAIADQVGMALDNARLFSDVVRSESRLRAVLDSTADAIVTIDLEGRVAMVNDAAETLCGVTAEEALGLPLEKTPLPPALVSGLSEARGRGDAAPLVFDITLETASGKRVLSCAISPVLDTEDSAQGWVAVARDITHIREVEAMKSQVIRTAAHDLKNPLSQTKSAIDILATAFEEPNQTQARMIELARGGVERMQRLIEGLLNIEHIEAGLALQEDVQLDRVLRRVVDEQGPHAEASGIALTVEIAEDLPSLRGSVMWLERAVSNYLTNAIKHSGGGSSIQARAWAEKGQVFLEIEDEGPGIPLEAQGRLFERFYRVPNAEDESSARGSGLGLTIVKLVIEQHGGRVYVRSRSGQGSVFGFAVPHEV